MSSLIDSPFSFSYLYPDVDLEHKNRNSYLSLIPKDLIDFYISPYTGGGLVLASLKKREDENESHIKDFKIISNHFERVFSPYEKIRRVATGILKEELEGYLRELPNYLDENDYDYLTKAARCFSFLFKEFEIKYQTQSLVIFSESSFSCVDYSSIPTDFERSSLIIDKVRQVIKAYIELEMFIKGFK